MSEKSDVFSSLEHVCQQQYLEIEKQKILILDVEEENRLLRRHNQDLLDSIAEKSNEAEALQKWCAHLQEQVDELDELRKWSSHLQKQVDELDALRKWSSHLQKQVDELDALRKWSSHLQEQLDEQIRKNEEREARFQRLKKRLGIFYPVMRKFVIWLQD